MLWTILRLVITGFVKNQNCSLFVYDFRAMLSGQVLYKSSGHLLPTMFDWRRLSPSTFSPNLSMDDFKRILKLRHKPPLLISIVKSFDTVSVYPTLGTLRRAFSLVAVLMWKLNFGGDRNGVMVEVDSTHCSLRILVATLTVI